MPIFTTPSETWALTWTLPASGARSTARPVAAQRAREIMRFLLMRPVAAPRGGGPCGPVWARNANRIKRPAARLRKAFRGVSARRVARPAGRAAQRPLLHPEQEQEGEGQPRSR